MTETTEVRYDTLFGQCQDYSVNLYFIYLCVMDILLFYNCILLFYKLKVFFYARFLHILLHQPCQYGYKLLPSSDEVLGKFRRFDFSNFPKEILYGQKTLCFQRIFDVLYGHFFIEKKFFSCYNNSTS